MEREKKKIKTALEVALERAQKIKISPKELERISYISKGKEIAGKYLREESFNLKRAFEEYQGEVKECVREGALSLLRMKLTLPKSEGIKRENKRAIKGILLLGKDKKETEKICRKIENLFNIFEKEREKQYEKVKAEVELHLREARETLEEMGFSIEIENQPEFKKRWFEVLERLTEDYEKLLREYKKELES